MTNETTIDEVASRRVDNLLTAIMRIRQVGNPTAQELARVAIAKDNAIASSVATNDPGINDNSPLMPALEQAWGDGYQTAVDALGELAGVVGDEQMKQAAASLVRMLKEVKPDGKSEATIVKHELRNLMVAIDVSPWHQHEVTGEQVKRICLTETAIARIRAAIGDTSHDG